MDVSYLNHRHDLSLSDWGPYSKKTFGLSHIHNRETGLRFDAAVLPGFYRRELEMPDALKPSGYLPWSVSGDLKQYSYRQQLEWKDRIYADLVFTEYSDCEHRIECRLVNRTDRAADAALHFLLKMERHLSEVPECENLLEFIPPILPGNGLIFDAMHPGEKISANAWGGSVYEIKKGIKARFCAQTPLDDRTLFLRIQSKDGAAAWKTIKNLSGHDYLFEAEQDTTVNGIFLTTDNKEPALRFRSENTDPTPETLESGSVILDYADGRDLYGIDCSETPSFSRHYRVDDLMNFFRYRDSVHQKHLGTECFQGSGKDCAFDLAVQPVPIPPRSEKTVYFRILSGNRADLVRELKRKPEFAPAGNRMLKIPESPYAFSAERMAAVILTNVVFPVRCEGRFIRHHTPGRLWNSLYTWDSGFIGLAMLDLDLRRAVENLNTYLTEPDDTENAFILHGTPLPVQIFLLYEIWNRTCDLEILKRFYPMAKKMYDYLAGHTAGSRTRSHCTEPLICTWDYFYNSGGWDDYPPQWTLTRSVPRPNVIPVISSACVIRAAKIMKHLAKILGTCEDAYYERDIREISDALRKYSWDSESGYFSYVTTDDQNHPDGFYRFTDGSNYNMGLDGTSPLIAGCADPGQTAVLWNKMQSERHLWTPCGISTVDRSASYYSNDGYWNGSVWMPHQWFIWKAALNDGLPEFAGKIAETALRLWEKETANAYSCFEQFSISSECGTGWHHFSGLSSPVICWHNAYFGEDMLTAGYDVCVLKRETDSFELEIGGNPGEKTSLLWTGSLSRIVFNGKEISWKNSVGKSKTFDLPKNSGGRLEIYR